MAGKSLIYKILETHLVEGTLVAGEDIAISIDQTLTQDATGTMAYLEFESLGLDRVKTLSVSYVDHNTLQDGFENADDHKYLQDVASKYGIYYSKAGNGICHQVHLERFARPGQTLVGADSHTPTAGGLGMFAVGVGGMDVAASMAGKPFHLTCPKVTNIKLNGRLQPWCAAKDIVLKVLSILTTKGNVGTAIEYTGEGVASLTVPERATITNMGAEMGITTSIFPSDAKTKEFLRAQGREDVWVELQTDEDAQYDEVIEIDLNTLVPMIACPHSPDNVKTVAELKDVVVDQVLVGSCTNSSYRDLMMVASMLKGRKIHPDVSFGVAPGSKQALAMITKNGALADIIASGARLFESACGFCVGCGQAPRTKSISLRTNNRNYEGRSGTKDALVHLVSVETAVASALTGTITDPREIGLEVPTIELPEVYEIDDSLIVAPKCDVNQSILRGPNIGEPPSNIALPETISAKVTIKVEDKITTDHIMPAGPYLKFRSNVPKYSQYVFSPVKPDFAEECKENVEHGYYNVIVARESYGQGSSREHAALCPMYLGVKAVIAKSIERIHMDNLVNFGILPLLFENDADYESIQEGDELFYHCDDASFAAGVFTVENKTKSTTYTLRTPLNERQLEIVRAGGKLNFLRNGGQ
ncbi:aconitate hydratase [Veillonella sp. VA137]|uniref:aconitate hydratase n=1 Tax=Veillonella sp. VA137 TaxID=741828 RepID=UPI000F8CB5EE|nr:aconitate hydratase [Veillonella sp. VA137]